MTIIPFGLGGKKAINPDPNTQGGKGASLVEMTSMGLRVPEGFIIYTDACIQYLSSELTITQDELFFKSVGKYIEYLEHKTGSPQTYSIRSSARVSMPGMMDTILNIGMVETNMDYWIKNMGKDQAYDCYSRLLCMFGEVVFGLPKEILSERYRHYKGIKGAEWFCVQAIDYFEDLQLPKFWKDTEAQYRLAIKAVWDSWNTERAIEYRKIHGYPDDWGTAVVVQRMVLGNLDDASCSGVMFTRNPDTGENELYGEFLANAQGEDVVSGAVTPEDLSNMEDWNSDVLKQLDAIALLMEDRKKDMLDIEFTVEQGVLYILQCRVGKRSSIATFRIAYSLYKSGNITLEEALSRCTFKDYCNVTRVVVDYANAIAPQYTGIPASFGVVVGDLTNNTQKVIDHPNTYILVRKETTPDDLKAMVASKGLITLTGGATSHAAVVARGLGIPCVVGCTGIQFYNDKCISLHSEESAGLVEYGTQITIDGSTGALWVALSVPVTDGQCESANLLIEAGTQDNDNDSQCYQYASDADILSSTGHIKVLDIVNELPIVLDRSINYKKDCIIDLRNIAELTDKKTYTQFLNITDTKSVQTINIVGILTTYKKAKKYVKFIATGAVYVDVNFCGFSTVKTVGTITELMDNPESLLHMPELTKEDQVSLINLANMAGLKIENYNGIKSTTEAIKGLLG